LNSIDKVDCNNEDILTLRIFDRAEEFRIEISGRFSGSAVTDAATAWKQALKVNTPRRISVDITEMTGYDPAGCALLREMQMHGTHMVAATPRSLVFLDQISAPQRVQGPSLVARKAKPEVSAQLRPVAAGQ
jgi:hypothetical protein